MPEAGTEESCEPIEIPALFWQAIKVLGSTDDSIPMWEWGMEHFETCRLCVVKRNQRNETKTKLLHL